MKKKVRRIRKLRKDQKKRKQKNRQHPRSRKNSFGSLEKMKIFTPGLCLDKIYYLPGESQLTRVHWPQSTLKRCQ
ncbi:axonemal dynein light chain domain containing 1 [Phyllostomus discolor]|uniref:Axonemal dynein light chain domain containing 1 n=1 Tax=Phyllostomus discolor TaxID=89673 RepID=A0A834DCM8_9CHIR|nr:axonemal dynein light chain domain containing 1 [Phyllostomus discolor]